LIRFLAEVTGDLIQGRHACLMTSDLHSEVVETSYAELREKNNRLKASEKKYRELAQGLEKQVIEKTREIQETQIRLMEQEKLASIGQLAAGVAHEINNPIGFVQSNLNTLSEYAADLLGLLDDVEEGLGRLERAAPDDLQELCRTLCRRLADAKEARDYDFVQKDMTKVIRDSLQGTGRIAEIVNDLKAFAHLDKTEREPADLNRGIRSTLNILRNDLRERIEVVEDLAPLPFVLCHPQHMNLVFLNLLRNAIQSIAERGRIYIATRFEEDHVRIEIRDTGEGIPERHLKRIFDPFFTTRPVGQGTGLGLNAAYNILRAHGGTIGVESEEGVGTVFTLRIHVTGEPFETGREASEQPPCRN
jgi:signal transduction histidine kinase